MSVFADFFASRNCGNMCRNIVSEFDEAGLHCCIRMGLMGFYCGYVMIPKTHPLYGIVDLNDKRLWKLKVNGGITYVDMNDDVSIFGWDAGHSFNETNPFYKDDAEEETRALARQLAEMMD